jgi:hypothetical protein
MPSSITLTVSHLPSSTSFFLSALQPLGYIFRGRQEQTIGFGPSIPANTPPDFWITQEIPGVPAGAAHVAFPASSRTEVQDFFVKALKAGGKIHGEPAQRDASGYYSAAVIDFDGNSIEAVYRPARGEDNKENIDVRSVVSYRSGSGTVVPARTAVSQVRSRAPTASTQKPSGDVLDTIINEVRGAANVARDLVANFKNNTAAHTPPKTSTANASSKGKGDAVVGTLLGVAAGAALTYAFTIGSKDPSSSDEDREDHRFQPRRPSVSGRSTTEPAMYPPQYSTSPSEYRSHRGRAIEAPPSVYRSTSRSRELQRMITMRDNTSSSGASTIRPSSRQRRMSMDSGYGPGARDFDGASHISKHAKRSPAKDLAPPTSYRVPTALTLKSKSPSEVSHGSRSRSLDRAEHTSYRSSSRRARSPSTIVRADDGAKTVYHVTETLHRTSSYPPHSSRSNSKGDASRRSSRTRAPQDYPLPPSRAATWAGSDGGASYMSARSHLPRENRTIVGRVRPSMGERSDSASVIGKKREVTRLDVTDRDVRPEDSVSQISVNEVGSRRSRAR